MRKKKKVKREDLFKKRVTILFFLFTFFSFLLLFHLFFLQVYNGNYYRMVADGKDRLGLPLFDRGRIFFEDISGKTILAAGQKKAFLLAVNPKKLSLDYFRKIYPLLVSHGYKKSLEESLHLFRQLKQKKRVYYELIKEIDKKDEEFFRTHIEKRKLGILLDPENYRFYPFEENAAHAIGFLAYGDDGEYKGRYGLERFYDSFLQKGKRKKPINFFAAIFQEQDKSNSSFVGGDIVVSLDPQIQLVLQNTLKKIHSHWRSEKTGGIILDPKNGKVYALALVPSFDPNHYSQYSISRFRNSLVSDRYEFGSVMKPLVMAIALDKNYVNANTSYYDRGSVKVGKHIIRNFDERGRGWVTMQEVLNQSLNTGMVFVSKKIPKNVFREYFEKYGLRDPSGIDLPNDVSGLTKNLESTRDIEFANMSFGQGIAVSPMVFVRAFSVLANGGTKIYPHLITKFRYLSELEKEKTFPKGERVLSKETSEEITRMLVNVFDSYHHGKVKFPHYSIAAKTGTAQLASPYGGYEKDKHLHSFVAYFPAYNPKYLVFLYTVDPKGVKYASQTLIEPFRSIARFLIHYSHIDPDR